MNYMTYETVLPYDLKTVFDTMMDLENAPLWHSTMQKRMVQTTPPGPVGLGTTWRMEMKSGHQPTLSIAEWRPYEYVKFVGSVFFGAQPQFIIHFEKVSKGTRVEYTIQPIMHPLLKLPAAVFIPIFGKRDLGRYFGALGEMLENS